MAQQQEKRSPMVSRSAFAVYHDGVPRHIRRGDVVAGDDPILSTHGAQFRPVDDLVEKATQWPGERRAVRFPERVTAREASAAAGTPDHRTHNTPLEVAVPHSLPPEHEDSPASPFAPLQPSAGVVADDVPPEQNPAGGPLAKDGPKADVASAAVSSGNVLAADQPAESGQVVTADNPNPAETTAAPKAAPKTAAKTEK